ncbi:pyridoxal-phosphate dependent enzyme [Defluviimonas sp. WL0002]|uniref:Pyridoxal-phosphate dependent enzyme n=1 Tax=Albidovulum marisflavi TaxID=2984159 RepID=A0ABT2ZBN2_9RHOB|nr:pyridoxal-phosphate dependent enzyme [Defluviimonas sp. WL0002]MCV2868432.1 pyridoxal-phosphate dependent enzyme [Defluviimonas sp. WL0002]
MTQVIDNPFRGKGMPDLPRAKGADTRAVAALLALCPAHRITPLVDSPDLAAQAQVARLTLKDERGRMGLGSFKALGAAHAIAREAAKAGGDLSKALSGRTYVTASAGNHGLSVAAGARVFGAAAVVYLSEAVPQAFADRLAARGARVVRAGSDYEQSMEAAARAAEENGWTLLSDSSWPGYTELPFHVMEGYRQMAVEIASQMQEPPSHVLLQAGVGGLAAAIAAELRETWGSAPQMIVVEPDVAPALYESIRSGRPVTTTGPASCMGRLDCKTPSLLALADLACDADRFTILSEDEAKAGTDALAAAGLETTPSGGAGVAALLAGIDGVGRDAHVLCIISEGPANG